MATRRSGEKPLNLIFSAKSCATIEEARRRAHVKNHFILPTRSGAASYRMIEGVKCQMQVVRSLKPPELCAMVEEFVSEAIEPVAETIDAARMATGAPGFRGSSAGDRRSCALLAC